MQTKKWMPIINLLEPEPQLDMTITIRPYVEIAFDAMCAHANHELLPIHRRAIFESIRAMSHGRRAIGSLAILTAERVLPMWRTRRPDDPLADNLLGITRGVLDGTGDPAIAAIAANKAFLALEDLGRIRPFVQVDSKALYAGMATYAAVGETLDNSPFQDILISETDIDRNLDPWSMDSAGWAASVWAGRSKESNSDPGKRREFWTWWLKEAIPRSIGLRSV